MLMVFVVGGLRNERSPANVTVDYAFGTGPRLAIFAFMSASKSFLTARPLSSDIRVVHGIPVGGWLVNELPLGSRQTKRPGAYDQCTTLVILLCNLSRRQQRIPLGDLSASRLFLTWPSTLVSPAWRSSANLQTACISVSSLLP